MSPIILMMFSLAVALGGAAAYCQRRKNAVGKIIEQKNPPAEATEPPPETKQALKSSGVMDVPGAVKQSAKPAASDDE